MNIKKQLGTKIKRIRQLQDLTQEELAEKIGIAPRTLSGIESGKNFVTSETLERILDVLNVSSSELFAFNHIKPKDELKQEIISDIQNLDDRNTIETVHKIVKAAISE